MEYPKDEEVWQDEAGGLCFVRKDGSYAWNEPIKYHFHNTFKTYEEVVENLSKQGWIKIKEL